MRNLRDEKIVMNHGCLNMAARTMMAASSSAHQRDFMPMMMSAVTPLSSTISTESVAYAAVRVNHGTESSACGGEGAHELSRARAVAARC